MELFGTSATAIISVHDERGSSTITQGKSFLTVSL